jgi:[ribosomal protein S18]-alanine N-acetyltransferase
MASLEGFHYRAAHDADIIALMQFVPAALQGSWSNDVLQRLLRTHKVRVLEAVSTGDIVGFAEFTLVLDESELLSLAIHPLFQKRGLGTALLADVLREAAAVGAVKMLLEVRSSNTAARTLYERQGFTEDGVRRGYYASPREGAPREDAVLYSLELESSSRD